MAWPMRCNHLLMPIKKLGNPVPQLQNVDMSANVGFIAVRRLVSGGARMLELATTLAWAGDGYIYLGGFGLLRVPESGGEVVTVTSLLEGEETHIPIFG